MTSEPLNALEKMAIRQIYAARDRLIAETGIAFEVDHIIPLARGGRHHPDNLQLLTAAENRQKGASLPKVGVFCATQ